MTDETTPEVDIALRPYLGDLTGTASEAQPRTRRGNRHLFADATGQAPLPLERPHLHAVDPATELAPTSNSDEIESAELEETALPEGYLRVDWRVVLRLTRSLELGDEPGARDRGSFDVAKASSGPETPHEEAALAQIRKIVRRHAENEAIKHGADHEWDETTRAHYAQAIFDQAFRYGRLQQYLREPDIEEISVTAHDRVYVVKTNGRREQRPPIAEDAADLEQMIADTATHRGRTFARPGGDIDLDIGGARLSATTKEVSEEPNLTVRLHNHVDIDLDDLVKLGSLNAEMAGLLAFLARANARIMVSGFPSAGKTTFLRALMAAVRPEEKIVTIETERELYLHKMPHRHREVQALQYIPPQYAGGDNTAGYPLERAFHVALRSGAQRILFAEIRGPEGPIAIKAMNAGKGSMSTIHANSADDAIHRFADILMSEQGLSDDTVPLRQIMRNVDYIVHLEPIPQADGTVRRLVSQISEIVPNDDRMPIANDLYTLNLADNTYSKGKLHAARRAQYARRGLDVEEWF